MSRLRCSQHVARFHQRGALLLYHDLFGFLLQGSADICGLLDAFAGGAHREQVERDLVATLPDVRTFIDVLAQLHCLVPTDRSDADERAVLHDMYPVRARWSVVVTAADGSVQAVRGRNPETTPELVTFTPAQAAVWRLIDGLRSVRDIAAELTSKGASDVTVTDVAELVAGWTHSEAQWTRCSTAPVSFFRGAAGRPPYLDSTMPMARLAPGADVPADPFLRDGIVDLRGYHRDDISDADDQFDLGETTLSHMFRAPHPALGGHTFTDALCAGLVAHGMLEVSTRTIVEIGGGTGHFAAGMRSALRRRFDGADDQLRYTIADISPALQASQRARLAEVGAVATCVVMDAEELPLADSSVDLVLCNEMIADLRTARISGASEQSSNPTPTEALAAIERYALGGPDHDDGWWLNLGAIRLLERLATILRPGGWAWVSEFGEPDRFPVESTHLDHPEFSIHFGHLRTVAQALGMQVSIVSVPEFIGLDASVPVLAATRTWFRNLRYLLHSRGVRLEKIAYTRAELAALCGARFDIDSVDSVRLQPAGERALGLRPAEFKALLLQRPHRDGTLGR